MFGKRAQAEYRKLLDRYLMHQFDYKVEDFFMVADDLRVLQTFFWSRKINNTQQNLAVDHACVGLERVIEMERNIRYITMNKMAVYEWGSLIILAAISLFCLITLSDGSWMMIIFLPILGTAIVLLLFVLYMLDQLVWKHGQWMIMPIFDLFDKIGLMPYIVDDMLTLGNVTKKMLKGRKVRVASYPRAYPDLTGKKINVVQF